MSFFRWLFSVGLRQRDLTPFSPLEDAVCASTVHECSPRLSLFYSLWRRLPWRTRLTKPAIRATRPSNLCSEGSAWAETCNARAALGVSTAGWSGHAPRIWVQLKVGGIFVHITCLASRNAQRLL